MQQQPAGSTKIRVDFSDSTGAKYSVNIENPSKDNVAKLLDFVDSIAPLSDRISPPEAPIDTNFGRVYGLLETKFKFAKFSSSDVLNAYQNEFHLISSLSIISTYLARLANRGVLTRSKSGTGWEYRISKTQQLTHVTPSAISSPPDNLIPP